MARTAVARLATRTVQVEVEVEVDVEALASRRDSDTVPRLVVLWQRSWSWWLWS